MSKAANRKKKRLTRAGRNRQEGEREPNGRLSRSQQAKDNQETVISARQRHHGGKRDEVKRPIFGYVAGRMYAKGLLGKSDSALQRLEAGNAYAIAMQLSRRTIGYPDVNPQAMDPNKTPGQSAEPPNIQERATQAANTIMHLESVLLKTSPQAKRAVHQCFIEEFDGCEYWPDHMLQYLKTGLDALIEDQHLTNRYSMS